MSHDKADSTPAKTDENIAQTVEKIMSEIGLCHPIDTGAVTDFTKSELVAVPQHRKVEDVTHLRRAAMEFLKPARRSGTARLRHLSSLEDWANRFKGETSALFADPDMARPSLTCIADYHQQGAADPLDPAGDPTARHCAHRAIYDFPLSDEWQAWTKISGKALEKDELGEFIEANAKDVMDPTPAILKNRLADNNEPWENRLIEIAMKIDGRYGQLAQLLAMSRRFQVYEKSDLTVSTNRDTGEAEIQFLNEHKGADGKPLNIPNLIIIAIPVFLHGAPYRMPVRFRYRKSGGNVRFILSLYNPEKAFEAAFREAAEHARQATDLPLFFGTPETP